MFNDTHDGPPPPVGERNPGGFLADPSSSSPCTPPSGANLKLWKLFDALDEDQTRHINGGKLQSALLNSDKTPFDLNTVNLLMNIYDTDKNGQIGFDEFKELWKCIKSWQGVFAYFDRDKSGSIDRTELQEALKYPRFKVTPQLLDILQRKYEVNRFAPPTRDPYPWTPPGIMFDNFLRACVVLKQVTDMFVALDTNHDGSITINYYQFLQSVLAFS